MALHGTSWHYRTEPSFPNSEATPVGYRILGTAFERSSADRARVTISFQLLTGHSTILSVFLVVYVVRRHVHHYKPVHLKSAAGTAGMT
jgi:hypothetical protein